MDERLLQMIEDSGWINCSVAYRLVQITAILHFGFLFGQIQIQSHQKNPNHL